MRKVRQVRQARQIRQVRQVKQVRQARQVRQVGKMYDVFLKFAANLIIYEWDEKCMCIIVEKRLALILWFYLHGSRWKIDSL